MNIRGRIAKLEQALHAHTVGLVGADGRRLPIEEGDLLDCLLACMLGEEHHLLNAARGARPDAGEGSKVFRLIQTFDTDGHREFMQSFRRGGPACVAQP